MKTLWDWYIADLWRSEESWAADHYPEDVEQW